MRDLFPEQASYAAVYDAHGILTPRTVLAHAIHLSPAERTLVKEKGCKIAHCPVSNTSLSSGLCPVRELLDEGVEVGLGTDVSGGCSASVLVAAREAAMVSRTLAGLGGGGEGMGLVGAAQGKRKAEVLVGEMAGRGEVLDAQPEMRTRDKDVGADARAERRKLSVEETLYLATRGGARCLGLGDKVGAFEVGMQWDAQLVEVLDVGGVGSGAGDGGRVSGAAEDEAGDGGRVGGTEVDGGIIDGGMLDRGNVELWGGEDWGERIAKWVFCGDDRNTREVYVRGRLVWRR